MTKLLILLALAALPCRGYSAELNSITAGDIGKLRVTEPAPAPAAGMQTYRSVSSFASRAQAVNGMMNTRAKLTGARVPVFESRTVSSGGAYTFEIVFLSSLRQLTYISRSSFSSAAGAMNAAMNTEASLLKAGVPVAERTVSGRDSGYHYELHLLAAAEPQIFLPSRRFSSKLAAANDMYNTVARLLAGKVGPLEASVTGADNDYAYEIWYLSAGE